MYRDPFRIKKPSGHDKGVFVIVGHKREMLLHHDVLVIKIPGVFLKRRVFAKQRFWRKRPGIHGTEPTLTPFVVLRVPTASQRHVHGLHGRTDDQVSF
jgi:hypothetical protein